MSDFLYSIISVDSSIEKMYWWPLIFEAAYRSSFSFQQPGDSRGEGIYFSKEQSDTVKCSFEHLWKAIYDGFDNVMVSQWFHDSSFFVQASLEEDKDKKIQIYLTMENSLLYQRSKEEMHQLVKAFLTYVLELYNLCHPQSVELFWDDVQPSKLSLIQVLKQDEFVKLSPVVLGNQKLSWKEISVLHNYKILLLEPFPIWLFRKWDFFPIF